MTLKEAIYDETKNNKKYLNDNDFKINLKIHNPRGFKLVIDYEHYHFKFDQFLIVIVENDYKDIEANIDTLFKETNNY